eukprot:7997531-Alexandrium_andersonii.AAC.1
MNRLLGGSADHARLSLPRSAGARADENAALVADLRGKVKTLFKNVASGDAVAELSRTLHCDPEEVPAAFGSY